MKQFIRTLLLLWGIALAAQEQPAVDVLRAWIAVEPDPVRKSVDGRAEYSFKILEPSDSVYLDARAMDFDQVLLNGRKVKYRNLQTGISLYKRFKKGRTYQLRLDYHARPIQGVYFIGWGDSIPDNNQVWTQGQGKYSSHWVPSFDDMREKVEFDLRITFDDRYEVAANGKLVGASASGGKKSWQFDMRHPMSSYLLAFAIGKYAKQSLKTASGIPVHLYYYPSDSLKVEPTYRHSRRIFDFLEQEIGVPYPWQEYRQVPVRDFLYAGMENTGCTLFSDGYMVDSVAFIDRNYVNVNAHELAHQWFGNLVTEVSGRDHWLHEGFATYYAYLAEKEIFGEDHFYWRFFETAKDLLRLSEEGRGEALTDPGAGSLTFYEKGAWALYVLRETLGEEAFRAGIKSYLDRYRFGNATVSDFISEMERISGRDLQPFVAEWLQATEFPYHKGLSLLASRCRSLEEFLLLQRELTATTAPNEPIIRRYWEGQESSRWKEAVVKTYFNSLSEEFIGNALSVNDWKIRQAIAMETAQVPAGLKASYESLLADPSYTTREAILYKLWIYFDGDRQRYLDQCRDIIGLPNHNVRLLWLTLALLTSGYETEAKPRYLEELRGYTSEAYNFETRQLAFQYLKEVFDFSDANLQDLVRATVHHSWQFRSYARALLDELLKSQRYLDRIAQLSGELKEEELRYIRQKLVAE